MPIAIELKNFIWKGLSVGWTSTFWQPRAITIEQLKVESCTLSLDRKHLGGFFDFPLVLKLTFVDEAEPMIRQAKETLDILVFGECLADVINLRAIILSVVVGKKEDSRNRKRPRRKIKIAPVWSAPNCMKLGLDEHLGTLPDSPAKDRCSTMPRDVVLNEREAIILKGILQRRAVDVKR